MIALGSLVLVQMGGHSFSGKTCEVIDRFEDPGLYVVRDSKGRSVAMPESRLRVLRQVAEVAAE